MTIIKKRIKMPLLLSLVVASLLFSASACSNPAAVNTDADLTEYKEGQAAARDLAANTERPIFDTKALAIFDEPWAMTALPTADNEPPKLLVTQKTGELFVVDTATGSKTAVAGIPAVAYGGQGGLGDVILAPDFSTSKQIYLSYAEAGTGG
ncbi:PQQ-dependent sugar dehydrogenase, partial [Psychrobacter sp. A3]|nr:PQQ-dependent sugar dehydrogenase [Psychrobacter sp. A3]